MTTVQKQVTNINFSQTLKDWIIGIGEDKNILKWDNKLKICHGFEDWFIKILVPLFKAIHYCLKHKTFHLVLPSIKVQGGVLRGIKPVSRVGTLDLHEIKEYVKFLKDLVIGLCPQDKVENVVIIRNFIRMCLAVEDSRDLDKALYFAVFVSKNPIVFNKTDLILFDLKVWNIRMMDKRRFDSYFMFDEYKVKRAGPNDEYKVKRAGPNDLCSPLFDMIPSLWYDLPNVFQNVNVFNSRRSYMEIMEDAPVIWEFINVV